VLPLDNLSPDEENAFFAGGVHEDILTNLSKIRDLRVISRTSTRDYDESNRKKSSEIAAELNVRYLVEGSVRRAGNQVRVTVQLIDGPRDEHMWAENYDRSLDDIFAIQSEIAKAIAAQIHAAISPDELAKIENIPTNNQAAYDFYLKALEGKYSTAAFFWTKELLAQTTEYAEEAVRLDPQFALGHSYLAYLYSIRHWFHGEDYPDTLEKARLSLGKAEAIDSTLADLHLYRGYYYYWGFLNYAQAAEEFALALSIQPNLAEAFFALGLVQRRQGRQKEALENQLRGIELDPRSPQLLSTLMSSYTYFRRYSEAAVVAEKLYQLDPLVPRFQRTKKETRFYLTGDVSDFLSFREEYQESFDSLDNFLHEYFNPYFEAMHRGEFRKALNLIESVEPDSEIPSFYRNAALARVLWLLGERERAHVAAQQAINDSASMDLTIEKSLASSLNVLRDLSWLAEMYAINGDREKATEYRETIRQSTVGSRREYLGRDRIEAELLPSYLALSETEKALEILDELLSRPGDIHAQEIRIDPWWRSFHGDPRFELILAKAAPVEK
jgi:TolB-like protein/Tfp pilus assembly protein PilF